MVFVVAGIGLLSTIDATTPRGWSALFMAVLGLGLGATMQNLVLAVQNNTAQADMGAACSVVAFFRSLGGSVGVSALGAVLAHQVADDGRRRAWPATRASEPATVGTATADPRPGDPARPRSGRSSRAPSATRPATSSWWPLPFAVAGAASACCSSRRCPLRTTVTREDELAPEAAAELQLTR